MKISFFETELKVLEIEKIVNFNKNYNPTKSIASKINVLFLYTLNNKKNIIICVDIIWISSSIARDLRLYFSKAYNTSFERVSICASHTHGSLNTDKNFKHSKVSSKFNEYLINRIKYTVKKAYENKKIETYSELITKNIVGISVNRRKLSPNYLTEFFLGKIGFWAQNFPNKFKHKDNKLISINFRNKKNNKLLAVIIKFTCHPVADPLNCEGSDFPGYLKRELSNYLNDKPIVFFLQGFAGDVRPNLLFKPKSFKDYILKFIIGNKFRKSEKDDSKKIAYDIIKQIKKSYHKNLEKLFIDKIECESQDLEILLNNNKNSDRKLNFTIWDCGYFKICFLSGEVLSSYKLNWNADKKIIGVAYSNGMTCYIPSVSDMKFGGYEVDKSRLKFNLSERISKKFLYKFKTLINEI